MYDSVNTALSAHPSPLVITFNEISGGHIGRVVVRTRCSAGPVLPLWDGRTIQLPYKMASTT